MRVLLLSQGRKVADQPDFDIAFREARSGGRPVEVRNIPFIGFREEHGEAAFYREVLRQNEDFKPDVVFFQFYHSGGDAGIAACCRELKAAAHAPLVFGSIGDLFYTGWRKPFARPLPRSATDLARHADAFFATAFGNVADELARQGGKNVIFLPNAFCPAHFPYWMDAFVREPAYDLAMVCSRGRLIGRKMVAAVQNNWRRRWLVAHLARRFGDRLAVFGRGWEGTPFGKGAVAFDDQVAIYRDSRVCLDAPAPILHTDYYSSDRPFFMLGSGTPTVFFHTPRFEKILREGEHVFYVRRLRDVCGVCEKALALPDDVRLARAQRVREFVRERHLIAHRVDTVISTAEALLRHRRGELTKEDALRAVRMHHFLPEVDLEAEYPFCTRNWVG